MVSSRPFVVQNSHQCRTGLNQRVVLFDAAGIKGEGETAAAIHPFLYNERTGRRQVRISLLLRPFGSIKKLSWSSVWFGAGIAILTGCKEMLALLSGIAGGKAVAGRTCMRRAPFVGCLHKNCSHSDRKAASHGNCCTRVGRQHLNQDHFDLCRRGLLGFMSFIRC